MSPLSHPVACERVRVQVSLELDGELSQLERAMLDAHVLRCADCRSYRDDVRAFARALRTAPLEPVPALSVRRFRRTAVRFQAAVAAAMAFAAVGVGAQAVRGHQEAGSFSTFRVSNFQTQTDLEREQELIEGTTGAGTRSGRVTVR